jgi:hypothetical protein
MNLENVERGINREKIAGFLVGIGIGTALGFFLRDRDEHGSSLSPRAREPRDRAPGKAGSSPSPGRGVETDRTAFAV